MHEVCILHRISRAHGNSKGEVRRGIRHKNNSNRGLRNLEGRNVGTKGKSPKQGLTYNINFTSKYYKLEKGSKDKI